MRLSSHNDTNQTFSSSHQEALCSASASRAFYAACVPTSWLCDSSHCVCVRHLAFHLLCLNFFELESQISPIKRRNKQPKAVSRKVEPKRKKVKTSIRRSKCSSPGVNCFYQTNDHWKLPPLWTGKWLIPIKIPLIYITMPGLSIHLLSHPPIHIQSSIRSFARSFVIHIHTSIHCHSYLFLPSIHPYVLTLVIPKKGWDSCVFFQKCFFFPLSLSTLPLLPSSVTNTCPHHL